MKIQSRRQLPHIYPSAKTFFITFRLNDSLPQVKVNQIKFDLNKEIEAIEEEDEILRKAKIENLIQEHFGRFDHQLDQLPYGECLLKYENTAKILYDKILQYDKELYDLKCFSIMPNHVHLLVKDIPNMEQNGDPALTNVARVDKWMKLIKGGSAYSINRLLGRSGALWAAESFDRYIRNDEQYLNSFYYTINNSIKASLGSKYQLPPYLYRYDSECNEID